MNTGPVRTVRRARSALDHLMRMTGVLGGLERRMRRGVTVLMYHRILPEEEARKYPLTSLAMPASHFRQQVEWLQASCEVVTVSEALASLGEPPRRPRVAITFDDGYLDNAKIAAPILEACGVRGTFYVTTEFVDGSGPLWFDRAASLLLRVPQRAARVLAGHLPASPLPALEDGVRALGSWLEVMKDLEPSERAELLEAMGHDAAEQSEASDEARAPGPATHPEPMAPADVHELARRGHEVGSHTRTHAILTQLSGADLEAELRGSRQRVADWLGRPPAGLAYPNGDFSPRVVAAARSAGYEHAVTTVPGLATRETDPFHVPRLDVTPDAVTNARGAYDPVAFRAELARAHALLRRLR